MSDSIAVTTAAQVLETLRWANSDGKTLNVQGRGSKRLLGRRMSCDHTLDLGGLSGIIDYAPNELVLTAKAGTSLTEIETALDQHAQELSFEPPDLGPLLGQAAGQGTVGGLIGCNLAGSRRIKTGSARDHFLGFHAVSGRAEKFKSGGRVVKNVTGFDLSKLIAGSYGTLAVMTELTLKVLPRPDKIRTVVVCWSTDGVYDHGGIRSMTDALASSHEVSGAAFIPARLTKRSDVDYIRSAGGSISAIRVEGPGPSVTHRAEELKKMLAGYGTVEELHSSNSRRFWKEVRDVAFLAADLNKAVWRLSVPPEQGSKVALSILAGHPGDVVYDWGGGLIWLAVDPADRACVDTIRAAVDRVGGHATLIRGTSGLHDRIPVFHPQSAVIAEISKRVKSGFDPAGVLNPGRMYEGV